MKYIHNTRQPLSQKQADKADKPFFNGSREKASRMEMLFSRPGKLMATRIAPSSRRPMQ
ncbi:hypothetical protein ACQ86K_08755 [Mucilaginibacter sp. P19]|uniref:hypothetical protein n=1 Tax=Mucilaginibacter sp. P19 TaxID=3423947 RepID=UPI003D67450D